MACIYLVTNVRNGKRYVGQTRFSPDERMQRHVADAKCGTRPTYFHNALLKEGPDNFHTAVIEDVEPQDMNERERHWIAELSPEYNMTSGGDGGDTSKSPNFIKAMERTSERMRGNTYRLGKANPMTETRRQNIIAARTGAPHPHRGHSPSAETRRKISETLKRKKLEKHGTS